MPQGKKCLNPISKIVLHCKKNLPKNIYAKTYCKLSKYAQSKRLYSRLFEQLEQKITEPMQIAIIGQFSSGKSTF